MYSQRTISISRLFIDHHHRLTRLRRAGRQFDGTLCFIHTFRYITKPTAGGCTPEVKGSAKVAANGAQTYTLPLSAFALQTACSFASVSAALAAGVAEIHIQVLGTNVQYVTAPAANPGMYANGLNIGPISFN